ncbi:MAG: hypothetical protein WCO60_06415 [Verrucomicrobiota bacterium]
MENPFPSEPEAPTPISTPDVSPAPSESAPEHVPTPGADSEPTAEPAETQPSENEAPSNSEASPEAAPDNTPAPEPGSIEDFAARARKSRLPVEDEALAATRLKEILLGGRSDVARAIAVIPDLPWIITVQGTASAWPDMKPSFRSQLLAGLARAQGESAPRTRLSLARGLYKVDNAAGLKLILLTLKVLRDKETGLLSGKGAPLFANVLIGRGKAWILQIPVTELKPVEADLLVHSALHGAFHAPQAPITQLSILRWAGALGKLSNLSQALDQLISRGISRWSGKWQNALRKEVTNFPESWLEVLKPVPSQEEAPASSEQPSHSEESEEKSGEKDEPGENDDESSESHPQHPKNPDSDQEDDEDEDDDDDEEDEDEESSEEKRPARNQRPVYVSKTIPQQNGHRDRERDRDSNQNQQSARRGGVSQNFNLQDTLRQIEQYTNGLKSELQAAQRQLRSKDDDRRNRRFERNTGPIVPGDPSSEELARLNLQLEARNAELVSRIQELTADAEDRAASQGLTTDGPAPDENTQLRSLLAFKLKEDFEDFKALEEAAKDMVVQQHYRSVLQHVFEVIQQEGVVFPPPEIVAPQ